MRRPCNGRVKAHQFPKRDIKIVARTAENEANTCRPGDAPRGFANASRMGERAPYWVADCDKNSTGNWKLKEAPPVILLTGISRLPVPARSLKSASAASKRLRHVIQPLSSVLKTL